MPMPPSLLGGAWINKPKVEFKEVVLAENVKIPGVLGDGSKEDRRPWGILEFETEVSQYH
jgi:hypothetical protein